jgi:cbb3-type cytochrome oxidase subunit 3
MKSSHKTLVRMLLLLGFIICSVLAIYFKYNDSKKDDSETDDSEKDDTSMSSWQTPTYAAVVFFILFVLFNGYVMINDRNKDLKLEKVKLKYWEEDWDGKGYSVQSHY